MLARADWLKEMSDFVRVTLLGLCNAFGKERGCKMAELKCWRDDAMASFVQTPVSIDTTFAVQMGGLEEIS